MATIEVPTEGFDPAVAFVPIVAGMPAGVRYELRDARSQQVVRMPSRMGLTFNETTGAITGTLPSGNGYDGLVLVALDTFGQEVARSRSFALYNPPPIPIILPPLNPDFGDLFAGIGSIFLMGADGAPLAGADGAYLTGAL